MPAIVEDGHSNVLRGYPIFVLAHYRGLVV
jgi:hypothetical protein